MNEPVNPFGMPARRWLLSEELWDRAIRRVLLVGDSDFRMWAAEEPGEPARPTPLYDQDTEA